MSIPKLLDENVIPKRYNVRTMTDKEQPRSIRFPAKLWDAIDRDAARCGRSAVKQMEALLSEYYGLRQVELNYDRLNELRGGEAKPTKRKLPDLGKVNEEHLTKKVRDKKSA